MTKAVYSLYSKYDKRVVRTGVITSEQNGIKGKKEVSEFVKQMVRRVDYPIGEIRTKFI